MAQMRWYSGSGWLDVKSNPDGCTVALSDGKIESQIEMGPRSTRELIRVLREGLKKAQAE